MSAAIKGKKYQLAGFDIAQKGTLVSVFATFCGADEDPANLPEKKTLEFADSSLELLAIYPQVSPEQITKALIGSPDLASRGEHIRLPGNADELLADLGAEQMALLLVEMGRAKRDYLSRETHTFIPAATPAPGQPALKPGP